MNKKKLQVIELNLGIDVNKIGATPLHPKTEENIARAIRLAKLETDAIKNVKNKRQRQQQEKDHIIESCFKMLLKATQTGEKIPSSHLAAHAGDMPIGVLIQSINKFIKSRDGLWIIRKNKLKGLTYYDLKTT